MMSETATKTGKPARRVRRSAEEARRVILDAAERRLAESGPEGIRLQDIAADVGISHPAILHHFESREGLVRALVERTIDQLRTTLLSILEAQQDSEPDERGLVNHVFEALSDRGSARLLAWLILTNRAPTAQDETEERPLVREIAESLHDIRCAYAKRHGAPDPAFEDTLFTVLLAAQAAFGDAVVGEVLRDSAALSEDSTSSLRFREWLGNLMTRHLQYKD